MQDAGGELPSISARNCLKSPEGASNVASQGTEAALFGPFRPLYTGQIHVRSVARTPFQTVSTRTSQNSYSTTFVNKSLLACLLALPGCIRAQPQRDVGWLHRLPYHPYQIVAQCLKVCFVPELGRECFQGLSRVVLATVEEPVYKCMDSAPKRLEQ